MEPSPAAVASSASSKRSPRPTPNG
jgi:hypothetical protein